MEHCEMLLKKNDEVLVRGECVNAVVVRIE